MELSDGYGYGYGFGYGDGHGYGFGDGYGSSSGFGDGYGSSFGDGYGYGYGSGDGDGDGYGDGKIEIEIIKEQSWLAYHYIRKSEDGSYVLRLGRHVSIGDVLNESKIQMCQCGLHASMLPEEARIYAPNDSVLTRVRIWGKVICGKDKLVATHRQIIKEVS